MALLADLHPTFRQRHRGRGVLLFDCPACRKPGCQAGASTTTGAPFTELGVNYHQITGSPPDWATVTLSPSIDMTVGCKWHGHVQNGEVTP